jgi:hypothetical protein
VDVTIEIVNVVLSKIPASIVEINDLSQGELPTVVEVGTSQLNIPQSRRFECTVCCNVFICTDGVIWSCI